MDASPSVARWAEEACLPPVWRKQHLQQADPHSCPSRLHFLRLGLAWHLIRLLLTRLFRGGHLLLHLSLPAHL